MYKLNTIQKKTLWGGTLQKEKKTGHWTDAKYRDQNLTPYGEIQWIHSSKTGLVFTLSVNPPFFWFYLKRSSLICSTQFTIDKIVPCRIHSAVFFQVLLAKKERTLKAQNLQSCKNNVNNQIFFQLQNGPVFKAIFWNVEMSLAKNVEHNLTLKSAITLFRNKKVV